MSQAKALFQCEQCKRSYAWSEKLAGQPARCRCGATVHVPPQPQHDSELYDLTNEPAPPQKSKTPAPPVSMTADPSPRVLPYQGNVAKINEKPDLSERVIHLQLPLVMLCGGLAVELGAVWLTSDNTRDVWQIMGFEGLYLIIETGLMLGAVFIAARLRGFKLGPVGLAILKLAAVGVAPAAAVTLLMPILMVLPIIGGLAGWAIAFCLYFALLGVFFDLDQSDTWFCVITIFVTRLMVAAAVALVLK